MESTLQLINSLKEQNVELVAVSKTKPISQIKEIYELGVLDFGENRVQEMVDKQAVLPSDIRWHQIGHLQKNKVKYLASFVYLIHSVDSLALLKTIQKEALKNNRVINILLQIKIAQEDSKSGLDFEDCKLIIDKIINGDFSNINLKGFMGMASFVEDEGQVGKEFRKLKKLQLECTKDYADHSSCFDILSMGMSGDYELAIEEGANMVRIGSKIFGERGT